MKRAPALSLLLLCGFPGCPGSYQVPLPPEAELHRVKTADGWELSLVRYRPKDAPSAPPVLLCHGISANARNMDVDADHSLARWLAAHGRDTWNLSWRATGDSDGVDAHQGRPGDFPWEALWREDYPAAIAEVRRVTGAPAVDFIGHSMGGMVLYAYLAEGGKGIRAAVTLGSPTRLDWGSSFTPAITRGGGLLSAFSVPVVASAQLTMQLHGQFDREPVQALLYNPENTSEQTWKRLISYGIADIQPKVAEQCIHMIKDGGFTSLDGKIDYRADMAKIRTPVLVVAGKADRLAVTPAVKDGYRALGGPKAWLLVGRETGTRADYGHMDLITGDRAALEVWPRVLAFLDAPVKP